MVSNPHKFCHKFCYCSIYYIVTGMNMIMTIKYYYFTTVHGQVAIKAVQMVAPPTLSAKY